MPASNSEARKRKEERDNALAILADAFGPLVSVPVTTMPDAWRGLDPS